MGRADSDQQRYCAWCRSRRQPNFAAFSGYLSTWRGREYAKKMVRLSNMTEAPTMAQSCEILFKNAIRKWRRARSCQICEVPLKTVGITLDGWPSAPDVCPWNLTDTQNANIITFQHPLARDNPLSRHSRRLRHYLSVLKNWWRHASSCTAKSDSLFSRRSPPLPKG
jgi:hypothetical protein